MTSTHNVHARRRRLRADCCILPGADAGAGRDPRRIGLGGGFGPRSHPRLPGRRRAGPAASAREPGHCPGGRSGRRVRVGHGARPSSSSRPATVSTPPVSSTTPPRSRSASPPIRCYGLEAGRLRRRREAAPATADRARHHGPGGADGVFGPGTTTAVKQFQGRVGYSKSGVVNAATAVALGAASTPAAPRPSTGAGDVATATRRSRRRSRSARAATPSSNSSSS